MAAHRKLKKLSVVVFGSFIFLFLLTWLGLSVPFVAPVFEVAKPHWEFQVEEVGVKSLEPAPPSIRSSPDEKSSQASYFSFYKFSDGVSFHPFYLVVRKMILFGSVFICRTLSLEQLFSPMIPGEGSFHFLFLDQTSLSFLDCTSRVIEYIYKRSIGLNTQNRITNAVAFYVA